MAREPEHLTEKRRALGEQLAAFRQAAGLTQGQLAKAALCDRTTVAHVEKGRCRADERFWQACDDAVAAQGALLAAYCELAAAKRAHEEHQQRTRLTEARARAQRLSSGSGSGGNGVGDGSCLDIDSVDTPAGPPVRLDADYVESLHSRIRELVALDVQFGGDQTCEMALRLFRSVHRKLGANRCDPRVEHDLYAAAGELGEVAGWLLYDAGRHDLVRRVNHEALHLSRLAGDSSVELLTLQNMSMHAGHLGRPVEALRIARMVLETRRLSPRLRALFHTREARALALGGDESGARKTFQKARSLYLDGVRDDDPTWAWWINDQEVAWHDAVIEMDSAEWHAATDAFQASIELIPRWEVRRRYNHLANLLHAQTRAKAWREANRTIQRLMPFVDEVASTRTATTMLEAITHLDVPQAPPSMRESARHLRHTLIDAGYGAAGHAGSE